MKSNLLCSKFTILILLCIFFSCTNPNEVNNIDIEDNVDEVLVDKEYSLLFIGNSLTYANDLPELIKTKYKSQGVTVKVNAVVFGNYGLEDHWNDGVIQKMINNNKYDFVIIQQGPSSQKYGRESLIEYGKKIQEVCSKNNTKLVFYMVWPSRTYYYTYDGVIANYTEAAKLSNAILAPVGRVWKTHFDKTGDFSYYGADNFHPSRVGSIVAADIIMDSLGI